MPVEKKINLIGSDAQLFKFRLVKKKIADIALPVKDIIDKIATTATKGIQNIKPYMLILLCCSLNRYYAYLLYHQYFR